MPPPITPGRTLLTLVALVTSTGCFLADWNETHIHNPTWPAHAKFHNGQTMSTGLALGLAALWHIWRPPAPLDAPYNAPPHHASAGGHDGYVGTGGSGGKGGQTQTERAMWTSARREREMMNLRTVVLLDALYWVTQASGYVYPGSWAFDPIPGREGVVQDYWLQAKLEVVLLGMVGVGWWLERGRILRG